MTPDALEWTQFALREFIFEDCDQAVTEAVFAFADSLTTRHSLTSRRSSLWALVRRSLDRPVFEALSSSAIPVVPELAAFVPSKLGSTPPPTQFTHSGSRDSQPRPGKLRGSKEQIENLYSWQIFLRHAARLYIARQGDACTLEEQRALATLDTLRNVVVALGMAAPVTATTTLENSWQPVRRRADSYPPAVMQHCELCWRSSMRCTARKWLPKRVSTNDYSARFCVYHVPREDPPPFNRYRTDIRYKSVFQKEIVLRNKELIGQRPISLIAPVTATPAEWRKAAYDIVHCEMQPPKRNAQSSTGCTLPNVFRHQQQGYSQKEIADALNVSKQAVSAAVSRLRKIKTIHKSEADIDFITEEPFALNQEATWHLFGEVRRLRASGQSTTQISRTVGRFKYTVQAIERWIGVVDQLQRRPHSTDIDEAARCFVAPAAVRLIRKRLSQPEQSLG